MTGESVRYMSAADVAALFGVAAGTVEKWRQRYDDFPQPDAIVGVNHGRPIAGWLPGRAADFRAWESRRPGRGAGGGRKAAVD